MSTSILTGCHVYRYYTANLLPDNLCPKISITIKGYDEMMCMKAKSEAYSTAPRESREANTQLEVKET